MGIEQRVSDAYAEAISLEFAPSHAADRTDRFSLSLKRIFDVVIAASLLVLLAPFLLVIAVLIHLDSAGPVLFRQTRLGRWGVPFEILKFRTMSVLENGERIVQATRNDPRVTRIGRFLRKSSLDELPQLVNVLRGDMSLIGPRPHARAHDAFYSQRIPHYCRRQMMRPGITGWAQVNGHRGETRTVADMRERVDCDLWYIAHFSLALDCKIILLTFVEVFRQRNAH